MANTRNGLFKDVTDNEWNDWKWQAKNAIKDLDELKKHVKLTKEEEEGVIKCLGSLRMAITPYYLSLMDLNDPRDPIRLQSIPTSMELHKAAAVIANREGISLNAFVEKAIHDEVYL